MLKFLPSYMENTHFLFKRNKIEEILDDLDNKRYKI